MKRWIGWILVLVFVGALGYGGYLAYDRFGPEANETEAQTEERSFTTAAVVRTDLISTDTLTGVLRYANPGTVFAAGAGTVTSLPEGGSSLDRGDIAYEVNGRPVIALFGDRPSWRILTNDADDGPDIAQLEANLQELGYLDSEIEVNDEFDGDTEAAVEDWQAELGLEETGVVNPGDVVFLSEPVRVAEVFLEVGSVVNPGVPVFATSSQDREILVLLDAQDQDLMTAGDEVSVDLPDDSVAIGVVRSVSRIVTTSGEGPDATRVVEVFVDLQGPSGELDETPVDVDVVSSEATDVLAVPVEALLALAEGGYAVEIIEGDRVTEVGVELGKFADGLVEIKGDVNEGDTVRVPE